MNKRQKAKYYQRLYECLLNKHKPIKVECTRIPMETYRTAKIFDYPLDIINDMPKDENGVPFIVKDQITEDFAKLIKENVKITKQHNKYEATVKIAWE